LHVHNKIIYPLLQAPEKMLGEEWDTFSLYLFIWCWDLQYQHLAMATLWSYSQILLWSQIGTYVRFGNVNIVDALKGSNELGLQKHFSIFLCSITVCNNLLLNAWVMYHRRSYHE
jgi:hypothetical protein